FSPVPAPSLAGFPPATNPYQAARILNDPAEIRHTNPKGCRLNLICDSASPEGAAENSQGWRPASGRNPWKSSESNVQALKGRQKATTSTSAALHKLRCRLQCPAKTNSAITSLAPRWGSGSTLRL